MKTRLIVSVAALLVTGALAEEVRRPRPPRPPPPPLTGDYSMVASLWNITWSSGVPPHPIQGPDGWFFNFPRAGSVHYVISNQARKLTTANVLEVKFSVSTSADAAFAAVQCGDAAVGAYLQRRGDDWSGAGIFQQFRYWAHPRTTLVPGSNQYDLTIPFDPAQWSDVYGQYGSQHPAQFAAALANIGNMGVTFGGCFFGHGVYLKAGSGQFGMSAYQIH